MIYLKDILFEAKVAHTQKSLQWVYHDYIPMTPKVIKQIMGDTPITTFHNLDWFAIKKQLPNVVGSKKSVSTYNSSKNMSMLMGGGVQTKGGIVLELEGKVLVAGTEDLGSVPDEAGRRWIAPSVLGKILGMKQFEGGGGGIYYRKGLYKYDKKLEDILWRYKTSLMIAPTDSKEDTDRFPPYTNKQKADMIKRWIDASNKFLLKNKKKIKDAFEKNVNNPKITTFHNLNWFAIKNQLPKVIGKKKSISTYTTDTEGHLLKGGGVQTGGGVVLEVEGKVLVAGTEDLGSVPDESGRRWIHPSTFGKIVGMKQFEGGGGGIYYRKHLYNMDKKLEDILYRYKTSLMVFKTDPQRVKDKYPPFTGKQKAELIKRYIDASNKFLLSMKKKIKKSFMDNVNNPKITTFMSKYGYNELLVYDVQVKDAYLVIDILGNKNDFEKSERNLKRARDGIKPYVKGKIYQGFASGVKKFINQRGGKV